MLSTIIIASLSSLINVCGILYTIYFLKITKPIKLAIFIFTCAILTHFSLELINISKLMALLTGGVYNIVFIGTYIAYRERIKALGMSIDKLEDILVRYTIPFYLFVAFGVNLAGLFRFLEIFGDLYVILATIFLVFSLIYECMLFYILIRKIDYYFEYRITLRHLLIQKSVILFVILMLICLATLILNIIFGSGPFQLIEGHLRTLTYTLRVIVIMIFYKDVKEKFDALNARSYYSDSKIKLSTVDLSEHNEMNEDE
eukprot:NODE_492_length_6837_cov_0.395963.p3 type:complete len:258 gc:universal NODE_492_length_6837_cov_0.395963:995-1768(+)